MGGKHGRVRGRSQIRERLAGQATTAGATALYHVSNDAWRCRIKTVKDWSCGAASIQFVGRQRRDRLGRRLLDLDSLTFSSHCRRYWDSRVMRHILVGARLTGAERQCAGNSAATNRVEPHFLPCNAALWPVARGPSSVPQPLLPTNHTCKLSTRPTVIQPLIRPDSTAGRPVGWWFFFFYPSEEGQKKESHLDQHHTARNRCDLTTSPRLPMSPPIALQPPPPD